MLFFWLLLLLMVLLSIVVFCHFSVILVDLLWFILCSVYWLVYFSICRMYVRVRKRVLDHLTQIAQAMTNQHKQQQLFQRLAFYRRKRWTIRKRVKRVLRFRHLLTMCNPFILQASKFPKVRLKLFVINFVFFFYHVVQQQKNTIVRQFGNEYIMSVHVVFFC